MPDKQKILAGRKAVEAYRTAHTKLYEKGWHKGIPEEHTPLLAVMRQKLIDLGFWHLQDFFDASEQLNILEAGGDTLLLEGLWH